MEIGPIAIAKSQGLLPTKGTKAARMKFGLRFLERVAPNFIVKKAMYALSHPKMRPLRPHEKALLESGMSKKESFRDHQIQTYHWPGEGKKVLLVHGWEGQTGNFAELIPRLQAVNYDVHAFDAPGHGNTVSNNTSFFEFRDWMTDLLSRWQQILLSVTALDLYLQRWR
ncbi:MAG: alpha/beta fold hydrolase [Bacteroidota bacterium]